MRKPTIAILVIATAAFLWTNPNASADTAANGNAFYKVYMEDQTLADGIGTYTAATGPSHPVGEDQNVLFEGDVADAWSSYNTIRSYTTSTDYVQSASGPASSNTVVNMDDYATVTSIGTTGHRVTYNLPGPPTTPDALQIVFDINVNGSTFDDSTVELTTAVTNNGQAPVNIGIRYQLDFQIAGDDGPTFAEVNPTQAPRSTENTYTPPGFLAYRIEDNPNGVPTFSIFGTSSAYPGITPTANQPEVLEFASWPDAFDIAFDYATSGQDVATSAGVDDSAVLYYFGATPQTAIALAPAQSVTVSESLFATPPVSQQEICDNGIDDDGDRLVDSADPDCAQPTPTPTPTSTATPVPPTPTPTPTGTPTQAPIALPPTGGQSEGAGAGLLWLAMAAFAVSVAGAGALVVRRRRIQ